MPAILRRSFLVSAVPNQIRQRRKTLVYAATKQFLRSTFEFDHERVTDAPRRSRITELAERA
ncbi:MAG: hypothetical protein U1A77_23175 [Pirellulales bacterium]